MKVTPIKYAEWLVSLEPQNTLASPSLTYIRGGMEHFHITERQANRLYGLARDFVIMKSRISERKVVAHQWGSNVSMDTCEQKEVYWEWRD